MRILNLQMNRQVPCLLATSSSSRGWSCPPPPRCGHRRTPPSGRSPCSSTHPWRAPSCKCFSPASPHPSNSWLAALGSWQTPGLQTPGCPDSYFGHFMVDRTSDPSGELFHLQTRSCPDSWLSRLHVVGSTCCPVGRHR